MLQTFSKEFLTYISEAIPADEDFLADDEIVKRISKLWRLTSGRGMLYKHFPQHQPLLLLEAAFDAPSLAIHPAHNDPLDFGMFLVEQEPKVTRRLFKLPCMVALADSFKHASPETIEKFRLKLETENRCLSAVYADAILHPEYAYVKSQARELKAFRLVLEMLRVRFTQT